VTTKVEKIKGKDDLTIGTNIDLRNLIRVEPTKKSTLIKKNKNQEKMIDLIKSIDIITQLLKQKIF